MGVNIRNATLADKTWIVSLLQEGSQNRHFGSTVALQASDLVDTINKNGGFEMVKIRGEKPVHCFVLAKISIAEINGTPASFLITLIDGDIVELHLAGTQKQMRRNGGFRNLIQHVIAQNHGKKLIARCFKKSTWAVEGLLKAGFSISKNGDPVELAYCPL